MFDSKGRYALMAVFVLAAAACLFYDQVQLAALAGLFFAFVLWGHFKRSSVALASKYFSRGDHAKAAALLDEVSNPDRLARNRRGYYEFMRANIALKAEDYEAAEYHFQVASRFPLGGKNDKAFVMIHLANLALRKKDGERSRAYVARAREMASTSRAKEIIDKIEIEANQL